MEFSKLRKIYPLTRMGEFDRIYGMKTIKSTNIFYSHFIVWLFELFFDFVDTSPWGGFYPMVLLLLSPILIVILPTWYFLDVLSNIVDWVCMKIFVELPLYGMNKMEELERRY
jgi:hypothetical protein